MKLEPQQESMLRGESGAAMALAMKTLVAYGKAFGAERLVAVKSGHLASGLGLASYKAYYHILERFVAENARVKVKTTVNPRPGCALSVLNRIVFNKQKRLERLLHDLGVTPNYSCVCYESENVPGLGDCLGWAESSAVQYANSVLGARTNRNSLLVDFCSALTGVTPEFGYLLDEKRRGKLLIKLDIKHMDACALGFVIGQRAVDRVPVVEHYPFSKTELKNMGGAMAASGAVALFHVEGVTPEAPDMKTVFDGEPDQTITITQQDLDDLRTRKTTQPNMVVFGCPQMTLAEALELAPYFSGKRIKAKTWFCMVPAAKSEFMQTSGYETVLAAGVEVNEYCPLGALSVHLRRRRVLTSSGKLFYYLDDADYGNVADCLRASGVST